MYKYYLTQRPPMPGAFPKPQGNEVVEICDFGGQRLCREIGREAWGSVTYKRPVSEVLVNSFEMVKLDDTDFSAQYQMLSRLKSDCDYYLGFGGRHPKHLWAGSVGDQIAMMRDIWQKLPQDKKPEWLTLEKIDEYERGMNGTEM